MALAAQIALAAWTAWLVGVALALVVISWLVLPLVLRWSATERGQRSPDAVPELRREGAA